MAKNKRAAKAKTRKRDRPRDEMGMAHERPGDAAGLDQLLYGFAGRPDGDTVALQASQLGDLTVQRAQRVTLATQIRRVAGNQHLGRVVTAVNDKARRSAPSVVMRGTLLDDTTQLATVNVAAAPLALRSGTGARTTLLGNLTALDSVRILSRVGTSARIHVETGTQRGKIGFVPSASLTVSPASTSQHTPAPAAGGAYGELTRELARARPRRSRILGIIQLQMTAAQLRRLIQPANAEYDRLRRTRTITATDLLNILNLCAAPLRRKISDYLGKGGRSISRLRLTFATASEAARLAVARDDALVGRLRRILGSTHPEVIFGTALSRLYPAGGDISTLRETNPNLARWLQRFTGRDEHMGISAAMRREGLQDAWNTMRSETPQRARPEVMQAVTAAPRGMALPTAERSALDNIEERAYPEAIYTSRNLGSMFTTRWGRPMRGAANRNKTYLHWVWSALEQLPQNHLLLNNVLSYFEQNTGDLGGGDFTDALTSARTYGRIGYGRVGAVQSLHAASAQNSGTIEVREPHLELLRRRNHVRVQEADGSRTIAGVTSVDARRRRLRLHKPVNVAAGAEIRPTRAILSAANARHSRTIEVREAHVDAFLPGSRVSVQVAGGTTTTVTVRSVDVGRRRLTVSRPVNVAAGARIWATTTSPSDVGEAVRITTATVLYGNRGNNPDTRNRLGALQPGNMFTKTAERTVGRTRYFGGMVYEGALRRTVGWIEAGAATALGGGTTMGREDFAWTVRHEVGHSLDTQVGGFSRFSAPSAAQWIKYPGIDAWGQAVAVAGIVLDPTARVTFMRRGRPVTLTFTDAARTYAQAIQDEDTRSRAATRALFWLQQWRDAPGGSLNNREVYNTVTQFGADTEYYNRNNRGIPPLGDRVYAAHYGQWFAFADVARRDSLVVGIPPYAYTCSYEFFAEHYAAYTGPGRAPERYARAVPAWALSFFDRLVGRRGAGPQLGIRG